MTVQKTQWMFGGAVFLASFLLFLVEPMAAKQLVPVFGGSAAVWITCLVFFQTALLAGYAYAFWLVRVERAWRLHAGLLLAGVVAALWWARVHGVMVARWSAGVAHLCGAGWIDRTSLSVAGFDQSADAGVVCTGDRRGCSLSLVRVVEPGFAAGIGIVSVAD